MMLLMNPLKNAGRALAGVVAAALLIALPARAQDTPIKFQLDWRFEGPAAMFLVPVAKGYFKAEKLNVSVDAGNGSGGAVTRVATGAYDMGFADLAALMEFHANNPGAANKPVAVMMVYNNTPAAVLALKKSGIKTPADLSGKKVCATKKSTSLAKIATDAAKPVPVSVDNWSDCLVMLQQGQVEAGPEDDEVGVTVAGDGVHGGSGAVHGGGDAGWEEIVHGRILSRRHAPFRGETGARALRGSATRGRR